MADLPLDNRDLLNPTRINFSDMFVDPNNPRIAPEAPPGYGDPARLFDPEVQKVLIDRVYEVYKAEKLENQIVDQGWVSVDPILVWRYPGDSRYVVIEGNTRTSVLTKVRDKLSREKEKLANLEASRGAGPETPEIKRQRAYIGKLEALIADTDEITVLPIRASTVTELAAVLPRLHGVRHVTHAQPWGPHAVGSYIRSLYLERFELAHPSSDLFIDNAIIDVVAGMLPLKPDAIRKNIQAATAFAHFKLNYADRAAAVGNRFQPSDQYYFSQILDNKVAREAFEFGPTDLELSEQGEEALFQWVFSKKRDRRKGDEDDNDANVFQKAEDMRVWQKIYLYDNRTGVTNFHKQLNVEEPSEAPTIRHLLAKKTLHEQVNTPLRTLEDLLASLRDLKADALVNQAMFLRPLLKEVDKQVQKYVAMLEVTVDDDD